MKETKELLVGANELALVICQLAKDGIQVTDAVSLFAAIQGNAELQAKLVAAFQGAASIKEEVQAIDAAGVAELVVIQATYVPKILEALKK